VPARIVVAVFAKIEKVPNLPEGLREIGFPIGVKFLE